MRLTLAFLALSLATPALADDPTPALAGLFLNDPIVKEHAAYLGSEGYEAVGLPKQLLVDGGCGFAGCDQTLLFSLEYSTAGANKSSEAIVALVENPVLGTPTVALAEIVPTAASESTSLGATNPAEQFAASEFVNARLAELGAFLEVEGAPAVILVNGACGFAGCEKRYLVVQRLRSFGAVNTQYASVAAYVDIMWHSPDSARVTPVELRKPPLVECQDDEVVWQLWSDALVIHSHGYEDEAPVRIPVQKLDTIETPTEDALRTCSYKEGTGFHATTTTISIYAERIVLQRSSPAAFYIPVIYERLAL